MIRIKSSLLLNTLKLSSSNVVLYFLPVIVTPILSRLYFPDTFGGWGIFSSTFTIISVAMFGSYDNAIVKAEEDEIPPLMYLCYIIGSLVTILSILIFLIGNIMNVSFFKNFPYPYLLYAYLLIHMLVVVRQNILNKIGKYGKLSITNLLIGSSQAVSRICWGLCTKALNGLIVGALISQLIGFIYLVSIRTTEKFSNLRPSWKSIVSIAKKYKKFPYFDAPALLLQFAALNLPIIILSFYFSRADIGCYSLIIQLLVLPISFIGSAMGKVYYQEVSVAANDNNEALIKSKTTEVLKLLSYIAVIPAIFIGFGGDRLIVWFLGNEWGTAGNIALCLSIWSIPTILTEPLKPIFRVREKQKILLLIEIAYFILSISLLIIGCYYKFGLYLILLIYSLSCTFIKVILFVKIKNYTNITYSSIPLTSRILTGLTVCVLVFRWAQVLS